MPRFWKHARRTWFTSHNALDLSMKVGAAEFMFSLCFFYLRVFSLWWCLLRKVFPVLCLKFLRRSGEQRVVERLQPCHNRLAHKFVETVAHSFEEAALRYGDSTRTSERPGCLCDLTMRAEITRRHGHSWSILAGPAGFTRSCTRLTGKRAGRASNALRSLPRVRRIPTRGAGRA